MVTNCYKVSLTVNVHYIIVLNSLVGAVDLIDELMSADGKRLKTLTHFINEKLSQQVFAITVYLKRYSTTLRICSLANISVL